MEKVTIRITICKECEFAEEKKSKSEDRWTGRPNGVCLCPDAPVHDFVQGLKLCARLNLMGDCPFFKRYAGNSNKGELEDD